MAHKPCQQQKNLSHMEAMYQIIIAKSDGSRHLTVIEDNGLGDVGTAKMSISAHQDNSSTMGILGNGCEQLVDELVLGDEMYGDMWCSAYDCW